MIVKPNERIKIGGRTYRAGENAPVKTPKKNKKTAEPKPEPGKDGK